MAIGFELQTSAKLSKTNKANGIVEASGQLVAEADGFNIVCDEGDLEFVTDAFEENSLGRRRMQEVLGRIVEAAGKLGDKVEGLGDKRLKRVHKNYFILDPEKANSAMPQSTVGVPLGKVPSLMGWLSESAIKGRFSTKGPLYKRCYHMACKFVTKVGGDKRANLQLVGFMALVYCYLLSGQIRVKKAEYAKKIHPLMHRTDFVAMYGLLSDAEKAMFKRGGPAVLDVYNHDKKTAQLIVALLKSVAKAPTLGPESTVYRLGFDVSAALHRNELNALHEQGFFKGSVSKGPTIAKWFESICQAPGKKDLMSPPPGCQPEDSMGAKGVELVGLYGAIERGVILEIRHMSPAERKDWVNLAEDVFDMIVAVNGGHDRWGATIQERFPTDAVWENEMREYLEMRVDDL